MGKIVFAVFFFIFIALETNLNAQTPYFYYYKGEKQYLDLDTTHIFVSVPDNNIEGMFVSNVGFTAPRADIPEKMQSKTKHKRYWTKLEIGSNLSHSQYWSKIAEVKNSRENIIVAPYFKNQFQSKIGLSNFFYVKLKTLSDTIILQQKVTTEKAMIVCQNQFMPLWFVVSIMDTSAYNAMETANRFYESGHFQYAEPDLMVDDDINCTTDTYFSQQWGLKNTGQNGGASGIDINICSAWQISTGSNITVAILDQGIDLTHPDLAANIYSSSFDSENGTIPQVVRGNHGTACAGIIGAVRNNAEGIAGVAPDCNLMAISNSLAGIPLSRMARSDGINWAWQNGADVISNSWGSSVQYQIINDAIDNAVTQGRNGKGCVVVFASGNDNASAVSYPAYLLNVIAVGASTRNGLRASFSNYGEHLDVVAPGVDIYTTDIQGSAGYNAGSGTAGNYLSSFNGTSAACPHVAGVAALMLSANPDLTYSRVYSIIVSTAQKVGGYNYQSIAPNSTWNEQIGYGLLDAYAAVFAAVAIGGPAEICTYPATYTLFSGTASSWSVSPTTGFEITSSTSTSAVVKAKSYNATSGVLTAVVNGKTFTKDIKTCRIYAAGSPYPCTSPETYTLNSGSASSWSVTPASLFQVLSSSSTSIRIAATSTNGASGTLTAVVNGVNVTRTITTCIPDITISGPSIIGAMDETYSLSMVVPTVWSVSPASAFEIVISAYGGVLVKAKNYDGVSGTLSATVYGLTFTKAIQTCQTSISGPSNVCSPQVYNIAVSCPNLQTCSWSITGPFNISSNGNSVGVTPIATSSETAGTLTATFPSGAQLSKQLYKCASTMASSSSAYSIYPNPASSVLLISASQLESGDEQQSLTPSSGVCSVQLVSVQSGALALTQVVSNFNGVSANIAAVPDGAYIVRLMQGNEVVHAQMIMVQR